MDKLFRYIITRMIWELHQVGVEDSEIPKYIYCS
jgi:hypothetical protein